MQHQPVTPEQVARIDMADYLRSQTIISPSVREQNFQADIDLFRKFRPIDSSSRFFEIGIGSGWFQVHCLRSGFECEGIELMPQLADVTMALGKRYGVKPKIRLGNIEVADIGIDAYDFVIAESVLEHVPGWQIAVRKAYDALKPGGVFYMCSSNKFSFLSGEFPPVPLYGWLPDATRRWIRAAVQGPDVVLIMDVNQFRYPPLRKFLKNVGFRDVLDYVEIKKITALNKPTPLRRAAMHLLKSSSLAKHLFLTFMGTTVFLCRK
jgi:2-polyprenyl-3-methyl-5-hydroxy-6-metoxy-1,4-benzoquinol methylase